MIVTAFHVISFKTFKDLGRTFVKKQKTKPATLYQFSIFYLVFYLDILNVMNNLDLNKTNVHNKTSIKILKIYGSPVYRPLETI